MSMALEVVAPLFKPYMRAGGKGASPVNLSLLFLIVKVMALVLFRSQDVALPFDKPRLIEKLSLKLYRQLHVVSP